MNRCMACLTAIADSKIYTWGVLNLYVSNHETRTLFETDHSSWVESFLVVTSFPPACTLSINDRCFAFTFDNNIGLFSALTTNKESLVVRSLAIFHELQGGTCTKVEYGF